MDTRLTSFWKRITPMVGPADVQLVRVHGRAKFSDTPLTALYAGNGRNAEYLRSLFFADAEVEPLERYSTPFRLDTRLREAAGDADLWLSELPPAWRMLGPNAADVRVPAWIRQTVLLTPGIRERGDRVLPRSVEREASRHVRRHGYRFEVTTNEDDARVFFRELYKPYVKSRFGPEAVIVSERTFVAQCRNEPLAKLYVGDHWVAGMLLHRTGKQLRFGWFGTSGDPPPQGASEVLDVMSMHYAYDCGVERVVLGNSRPCLTDGVVRYKSRFHPRIEATRYPQVELSISVRKPTKAVFECLDRQPLIAPTGEVMGAYRVVQDRHGQPGLKLERLHVGA